MRRRSPPRCQPSHPSRWCAFGPWPRPPTSVRRRRTAWWCRGSPLVRPSWRRSLQTRKVPRRGPPRALCRPPHLRQAAVGPAAAERAALAPRDSARARRCELAAHEHDWCWASPFFLVSFGCSTRASSRLGAFAGPRRRASPFFHRRTLSARERRTGARCLLILVASANVADTHTRWRFALSVCLLPPRSQCARACGGRTGSG